MSILVANAMGIHRDDKFKMYAFWHDLGRILKDANENILESPFKKETASLKCYKQPL